MSDARFGEAAQRLCSAASLLLGWRPNVFWTSTPAELALALMPPREACEPVSQATVDALRERFPDN